MEQTFESDFGRRITYVFGEGTGDPGSPAAETSLRAEYDLICAATHTVRGAAVLSPAGWVVDGLPEDDERHLLKRTVAYIFVGCDTEYAFKMAAADMNLMTISRFVMPTGFAFAGTAHARRAGDCDPEPVRAQTGPRRQSPSDVGQASVQATPKAENS